MPIPHPQKTVLVVEDNPGHYRLMQEAFKKCQKSYRTERAIDGADALSYLRQQGQHSNAPVPDIILLDLNLPRIGGKQVLSEIKTDPKLKQIPVVVISASNSPNDVRDVYDLHGNCYLRKSGNLKQLFKTVKTIEEFWLETALLASEA